MTVRRHPPHFPVVFRAVGQEQQLVASVKSQQIFPARPGCYHIPPALKGKDCLDEIFPQFRVVQSAFIFHRQQREVLHKSPGKQADALFHGHAFVVYTLTRSMPLLGESPLKIKPARSSVSSSWTRRLAQASIWSV